MKIFVKDDADSVRNEKYRANGGGMFVFDQRGLKATKDGTEWSKSAVNQRKGSESFRALMIRNETTGS